MRIRRRVLTLAVSVCALFMAATASAQSRFAIDFGAGIDPSINGNVNSGVIGVYQGQTTAILPNSYSAVYGTGIEFRAGVSYVLNNDSELRATFIWQSADANLVRLGDYGSSSLYAQYSDYKSFGLDLGYRRYIPLSSAAVRPFGEATIGIADVNRINVELAAPQSQLINQNNDFYDGTAAFTWSISAGVLVPVGHHMDVTAQVGLRHVGGLAQVDQLVGTGLSTINDNSARLTFPVVVGLRFGFK
jgi:Outer membrane protein beta-barrel domain